MKITILYDNDILTEGCEAAWGFSAWIEVAGKNILFDTGWDGRLLLHNMKVLGFRPSDIDIIFLSHQHWDHIGGLNHVLHQARNVKVYVPESFSVHIKNEISSKAIVCEVSKPGTLFEGAYSTGILSGSLLRSRIKEQSLAVETSQGLVVVTGCSHPGLKKILDSVRQFGIIHGVIGGFHGFSKFQALKGIELLVPTHCTQHKKEIEEIFRDTVEPGGVGWSKELKGNDRK